MNSSSELSWETVQELADEILLKVTSEPLSDVEMVVLRGAFEEKSYEKIAAGGYTTQYLSEVGSQLWKKLSDGLGQSVSKKNFREALRRYAENRADPRSPLAEPLFLEEPVPLDFPYVERVPYEDKCYGAMLEPAAIIRIKAPQQMGKTTVAKQLCKRLDAKGFRIVSLSFKEAEKSRHLTNLDKFLRWFCNNVCRQLKLPDKLDEHWNQERFGSKVSCKTYFEDYLLAQKDTPLVLCLDDVDFLFPFAEISEEFFAMLRSWYDQARSRRDILARLRMVLIHSTQDYIRLNINKSPFNVGILIDLSDFSQQQVQYLAKQHGLDWDAAQVEQLMKMVGGYPPLVQQAFSHLNNHQHITLNEFLGTASTESGIYGNYLRSLLFDLQKYPELASALREVVTATESVQLEPQQAYKLYSIGLVKWKGNEVESRCNLFRQYFCTRLGNS